MRRAAEGEPTLMESITYRYRGHSIADPARYRTTEEVQLWRDQDPIERFYRQLQRADMITPEERTEIEERVDREVDEAAEFAENSPEPDPAGLMDFLYVDPRPNV
jgi:pyruvate dehydrogenase E1 component alpha subunit